MKQHDIWLEGYAATGERGTATFLGSHEGETFKQACENAVRKRDMDKKYYNPDKNTFWACRFFDNEKDARKSFG